MLFPWARAEVYCHRHGAAMIAPRWTNIMRIGPWLRSERDKRYYLNAFSTSSMVSGVKREFLLRLWPQIDECQAEGVGGAEAVVVKFQGMHQYFEPFLSEQLLVARRLREITNPTILKDVAQGASEPFIGVHIRRGDFLRGGIAIPDSWYQKAITRGLERFPGLPVRVFSDAAPDDLVFLQGIDNVRIMPPAPALHDLLLLGQASMVVGTSRSTFSMWAVFLGQMPSVWHSCEPPPCLSVSNQVGTLMLE